MHKQANIRILKLKLKHLKRKIKQSASGQSQQMWQKGTVCDRRGKKGHWHQWKRQREKGICSISHTKSDVQYSVTQMHNVA